jgi:hypothetical protein
MIKKTPPLNKVTFDLSNFKQIEEFLLFCNLIAISIVKQLHTSK